MKINDKNLAAFASSGEQIDRQGYLDLSKGGEEGGNGNFTRRWFLLKGNLLFYFEKKTGEPLGVIILEGSTIELADHHSENRYCFKIVFPTRSYLLGAESQESLEGWMKALASATFEYIKLMATELQRQLDELCVAEQLSKLANFCVFDGFMKKISFVH